MAKGNIGNLLQHFVGLRCAQALVAAWHQPKEPILYVDCYSMAPWEKITGDSPQGFDTVVRRFPVKAQQGDFVALTFLAAWEKRYSPNAPPDHPRHRDYPNTAVLLRTAFPDQAWEMRLHDIEHRHDLQAWGQEQTPGRYDVGGKWTDSRLILKAPSDPCRPVMVMLDPNQIIGNANPKSDDDFYLTEQRVKFLLGTLALNLVDRPKQGQAQPAIVTLFSYSDADPEGADQIVTSRFAGWSIERVRSGPRRVHTHDAYHLAWIASCGLPTPLIPPSAQSAWDEWSGTN